MELVPIPNSWYDVFPKISLAAAAYFGRQQQDPANLVFDGSTTMLARFRWALLAGLCMAFGLSAGQEKDAKTTPRPDANTVEVRFADDSVVKMILQNGSIDVATRFGKLSVPAQDMRRIELGMRIPEATAKRIEAALANLGNADFKKRDAAVVELIGLRELAYPALLRAARSSDAE